MYVCMYVCMSTHIHVPGAPRPFDEPCEMDRKTDRYKTDRYKTDTATFTYTKKKMQKNNMTDSVICARRLTGACTHTQICRQYACMYVRAPQAHTCTQLHDARFRSLYIGIYVYTYTHAYMHIHACKHTYTSREVRGWWCLTAARAECGRRTVVGLRSLEKMSTSFLMPAVLRKWTSKPHLWSRVRALHVDAAS